MNRRRVADIAYLLFLWTLISWPLGFFINPWIMTTCYVTLPLGFCLALFSRQWLLGVAGLILPIYRMTQQNTNDPQAMYLFYVFILAVVILVPRWFLFERTKASFEP